MNSSIFLSFKDGGNDNKVISTKYPIDYSKEFTTVEIYQFNKDNPTSHKTVKTDMFHDMFNIVSYCRVNKGQIKTYENEKDFLYDCN